MLKERVHILIPFAAMSLAKLYLQEQREQLQCRLKQRFITEEKLASMALEVTGLGAMPWEERGKKRLGPFDLQHDQHGQATCRDEQDMLLQMDDVGVFQGLLS